MADRMVRSVTLLAVMAFGALRADVPSNYVPRLTSEDIGGKTTASTFVLDQPRCVFNQAVNATDRIWLVVSESSAVDNFTNPQAPDQLPYQDFGKNRFYLTMNTALSSYPCPDPEQSSDEITVLRVGSETGCMSEPSRPDCNGPLPGPGPYRVRFLAFNSDGPVAETSWSSPITLIQGKSPKTIDPHPGRLSAGTIALTAILSILSAILIAALITALIYKYSDLCDSADIVTVRDSGVITRYTTHHIYDQPGQNL